MVSTTWILHFVTVLTSFFLSRKRMHSLVPYLIPKLLKQTPGEKEVLYNFSSFAFH